jgi:hypothetical protein
MEKSRVVTVLLIEEIDDSSSDVKRCSCTDCAMSREDSPSGADPALCFFSQAQITAIPRLASIHVSQSPYEMIRRTSEQDADSHGPVRIGFTYFVEQAHGVSMDFTYRSVPGSGK